MDTKSSRERVFAVTAAEKMPAGRGNTLNVLVYFLSRSKLCHLSLSTASKQCTANGTVMSGNSAFFINEIKQMLNKLDGKKKLLICVSRNDQISKVKVILEYFLVYFVARSRLTHRRLVVFLQTGDALKSIGMKKRPEKSN